MEYEYKLMIISLVIAYIIYNAYKAITWVKARAERIKRHKNESFNYDENNKLNSDVFKGLI